MAILNVNLKNNQSINANEKSKEEKILKTLQANGYMEIKDYENKVEEFIEYISGLAVYKKVCNDIMGNQIRFFLRTEISDSFIKPIFEGEVPPFMDKDSYKDLREDIYSDLFDKYLKDNKDDNDPFREI